MIHNKPHTRISTSQAIKLLLFVLVMIIAYLFALNGRYCRTGADTVVMFDKWKRELVIPTTPLGYKKPNPMN